MITNIIAYNINDLLNTGDLRNRQATGWFTSLFFCVVINRYLTGRSLAGSGRYCTDYTKLFAQKRVQLRPIRNYDTRKPLGEGVLRLFKRSPLTSGYWSCSKNRPIPVWCEKTPTERLTVPVRGHFVINNVIPLILTCPDIVPSEFNVSYMICTYCYLL